MIQRLREIDHLGSRLGAIACIVLAGYLALAARDIDRVRDGAQLVQRGEFAAAAERVDGVASAPASREAAIVSAFAAAGAGDRAAAERAFARAVDASPNDWALRRMGAHP